MCPRQHFCSPVPCLPYSWAGRMEQQKGTWGFSCMAFLWQMIGAQCFPSPGLWVFVVFLRTNCEPCWKVCVGRNTSFFPFNLNSSPRWHDNPSIKSKARSPASSVFQNEPKLLRRFVSQVWLLIPFGKNIIGSFWRWCALPLHKHGSFNNRRVIFIFPLNPYSFVYGKSVELWVLLPMIVPKGPLYLTI